MRTIELELEELMNIVNYGTIFGARAINEDLRALLDGKITKKDVEDFIATSVSEDHGYEEEDREETRNIFNELIKE